MKIIYYSDDIENSQVCQNVLSRVTEKDSLITIRSQTAYKDLIVNNIIPLQKEIDCIIADSASATILSPREIVDVTRQLSERINCSNNDFKINSIPIILVIKDELDLFSAQEHGFDDILKIDKIEEFEGIANKTLTQVKSWRKRTLEDLDNLGIKFNSGSVDYTTYDYKRFRKKTTQNLSTNFVLFPRKLNYYWTVWEKHQLEQGIEKFWKLLKRYEKDASLREEKQIHKFLKKHPYMLKRDIYGKQWYEPYLEDFATQEDDKEPDFALKPNFSFRTDLSIVEVKLPSERFIKKKRYHKDFYANIYEYLGQVLNYKEYLESEEYQDQIFNAFKENPQNINYKLLIGRKKDKEENIYHINKKMRQYNIDSIELLTYDELIELQLRLMDELNLLEVR